MAEQKVSNGTETLERRDREQIDVPPSNEDTTISTLPELAERDSTTPQQGFNWGKTLKKYGWLVPFLALALTVSGIAVFRLRTQSNQEATVNEVSPLAVKTATAQRGSVQAWASSEGTAQAVQFKHLAFDVTGDITYIANRSGRNLREGDRVRKGELLAKIDDRELQANVNKAQAAIAEAQRQRAAAAANVAQAQTQVTQARSQVRQAQAQLRKAQAARNLAQSELQRYQQLYNSGALSESDFETRRNAVRDAETEVQAAQAQVSTTQTQVQTAQTQVRAAQEQLRATDAQVATAKEQLTQARVEREGTRLYAPFNGIVAYLNIRENEYYTPQAIPAQGDYQSIIERVPIVVIDPSRFEAIADFPSDQGSQIEPGQTSLITSDTALGPGAGENPGSLLRQARARGEVFAVNPAVSPGGRAIQITTRIRNGGKTLQHGERVNLWVATEEKSSAITVPLSAVVYRDQVPYVFIVNETEGTVEQRQVELGIAGLTEREIKRGVSSGEQVVTEGQSGLVDGAPVKVLQSQVLIPFVS